MKKIMVVGLAVLGICLLAHPGQKKQEPKQELKRVYMGSPIAQTSFVTTKYVPKYWVPQTNPTEKRSFSSSDLTTTYYTTPRTQSVWEVNDSNSTYNQVVPIHMSDGKLGYMYKNYVTKPEGYEPHLGSADPSHPYQPGSFQEYTTGIPEISH